MLALFLWKRTAEPWRLPPEKLRRAIVSGVRYIINSPSIKIVLIRSMVTGVIGGAIIALMPLVAQPVMTAAALVLAGARVDDGVGAI